MDSLITSHQSSSVQTVDCGDGGNHEENQGGETGTEEIHEGGEEIQSGEELQTGVRQTTGGRQDIHLQGSSVHKTPAKIELKSVTFSTIVSITNTQCRFYL